MPYVEKKQIPVIKSFDNIQEIPMIGRETFKHLDLALKAIVQNLLPLSGVSLVVVGDFLQLPTVNQKRCV